MYQVQDSYVRFNQRDHMGSQMMWDAYYKAERDKLKEKQRLLMSKGRLGYESTAWGLDSAADSLLSLMNFSKNQPDMPATAWQSDLEPSPVGRPETFPEEASQIVRKAAELLGADQVGFAELDRRWVYSHYFDAETKKAFPIKFSDEPGYEEHDQPVRLEDGTRVIPKEMKYVVVMLPRMGQGPGWHGACAHLAYRRTQHAGLRPHGSYPLDGGGIHKGTGLQRHPGSQRYGPQHSPGYRCGSRAGGQARNVD